MNKLAKENYVVKIMDRSTVFEQIYSERRDFGKINQNPWYGRNKKMFNNFLIFQDINTKLGMNKALHSSHWNKIKI